MIEQLVLKRLLEAAYDLAKKVVVKEKGCKLLASPQEIENSVAYHLTSVENWSAEVKFTDLKKAKYTSDIFIELDLFLYPRRVRIDKTETVPSVPLENIFSHSRYAHIVLLGQPGAGKTTSVQHLCQLLLHDEEFCADRFDIPILIKCRDLNSVPHAGRSTVLVDQIFSILGLKLEVPPAPIVTDVRGLKQKLAVSVLDELRVLLMIDGFDEFTDMDYRVEIIEELSHIALHLNKSTMIVTSRTGDFVYDIKNTVQYEICPLSKQQISTFAERWLADKSKASDFLSRVYSSPFADTAIRPLTLAHLCAIYERIGKIPDKPKTIYKKIVNLLLEEWDQQRTVKRTSKYAHFEIDRKFEFLCQLAYVLTTSLQKTAFAESDLKTVYRQIYRDYDLIGNEIQQVISEIESHTGLMVQSGYEEYEFAHKSLQEYLAAEYLVKLPSIPGNEKLLTTLPNELAIAISISSSPTEYFSELVLSRFARFALAEDFLQAFLNRLLLEKPDFNSDFKVTLAFVSLYTLHVEWNILRTYDLKVERPDRLFAEFENTIRQSTNANAMAIIRSSYELDRTYEMDDGDDLLALKQKRQVDALFSKMAGSFLGLIYLRRSFLDTPEGRTEQEELL